MIGLGLLFILVEDPLSSFLPSGVMEFIVPGLVAAGLFCWVIYKLLSSYNLIPSV